MELWRLPDPCHHDLAEGGGAGLKVEQVFLAQENLVKCGAVVAPVTDWLLYDTIYTERFMAKYSYSKVD